MSPSIPALELASLRKAGAILSLKKYFCPTKKVQILRNYFSLENCILLQLVTKHAYCCLVNSYALTVIKIIAAKVSFIK
jgi:hypothetical protein